VLICNANLPPSIIPASTTTQIDEKVTLDLAVLISDPDNNLDLSTLKIIIQPESKAIAFIDSEHKLTIDYKGNSFTGKDHLTIEVCDLAGSCAQQEITIDVEGDIIVYNAISPNGDSKNDTWMIKNIELLQDTRFNHVTIFNRWGDAVFETDNYDNLGRQFNGRNKNGSELPAGTYFYKITFASGRKLLTGYISLKR
jgi:gliding motility-associated-like protein